MNMYESEIQIFRSVLDCDGVVVSLTAEFRNVLGRVQYFENLDCLIPVPIYFWHTSRIRPSKRRSISRSLKLTTSQALLSARYRNIQEKPQAASVLL